MTKEQRALLERLIRVTDIFPIERDALRACLAQLDAATRTLELAREHFVSTDDGHMCASENACTRCEFGYALAAYDNI